MIQFLKSFLFSILLFCIYSSAWSTEINYTVWKFNDLSSIGGIAITPEGNPEIITIENDSAYLFDGSEDRVVIDNFI